jgi:hypothetical protein
MPNDPKNDPMYIPSAVANGVDGGGPGNQDNTQEAPDTYTVEVGYKIEIEAPDGQTSRSTYNRLTKEKVAEGKVKATVVDLMNQVPDDACEISVSTYEEMDFSASVAQY